MTIDPATGMEEDHFAPFRLGDAMAGAVPMPGGPQTIADMIARPAPPPTELPRLRIGQEAEAPPSLIPPAPPEPSLPTLGPASAAPLTTSAASAAPDQAAMLRAVRAIGPDSRVSGLSRKSEGAIRKATGKLNAVEAGDKGIIDRRTQLNEEKANEIVRDEDEVRLDRKADEANALAERAKVEGHIVELKDTAKELREKHAKDYEKPYFETKGAAKTWLSALSVGLGAFAASVGRTPNFAWTIMEKFMDDHAARERSRLQKDKEEIERQGGDVAAAERSLRDYDTITRPQQEAALLRRAGERRTALLARHGADEAKINGDALKQQVDVEAAKREADLEGKIAQTVTSDNSEQQKIRRQIALSQGSSGGTDLPDEKLTAETRKAQAVINGAMTATREAAKNQYGRKDVSLLNEMVSASRNVDPSDPTKFWSAMNQIKGKFYTQMTPSGQRRFNAFFRGAQDMERITSGGAIGTHEIADFLAASAGKGSESVLIQRMRDMLPATGQPNKIGAKIEAAAAELGLGLGRASAGQPAPGRQAPIAAPKADPKAAAGARAESLQLLRASNLSELHRRALEEIRDNPNDPRAAKALAKIRSAY